MVTEPVERWGPARKTEERTVELEGAEVLKTFTHWGGPSTRTYVVDRVEVTTRWTIGQEEESRTVVRLDCREVMGGRVTPVHVVLHPEDLDEVPAWLEGIITRASPRDVG